MSVLAIIGYIAGTIGFIATIVAAILVVRSTTVKQTIESQKDLIDILGKKVEALEASDLAKATQIESLQREVDTFKNIPLQQIVATQEQILKTQEEIIKLLGTKGGLK